MLYPESPILIVDDVPEFTSTIAGMLRSLGFKHVDQAYDGEQAYLNIIAAKASRPYGLIISDLHMPKMTGLELLKQIRSQTNAAVRSTPFLLTTTKSERELVLQAVKLGVTGYLLKPIALENLKEKIDKMAQPVT